MNCPACQTQLTMTERQGVEIDYCPKCRGVWLDRGELDKLIERGAGWRPAEPARGVAPARYEERDRHDDDDRRYGDDRHRYPRKKREGFLSELFDFD